MATLTGLFGVIVGSFLNVVAYRLPRKESIVAPPSRCTTCNTRIKVYDNIPVISWLLLHGRCRSCKAKISPRYLLVELGTGLLFAIVAEKFYSRSLILMVAILFFAAVTVTLALIDLDTHSLPNRILVPSYFVGAFLLGVDGISHDNYGQLVRSALGLLALASFYLILALVYPGGMGMGDVKYAGFLGLFLGYLGWGDLLVATFSTFILGGIYGVTLIITRQAHRKSGVPFGPWMSVGSWVGIIFGASILHHYYSLFGLVNRA